MNERGKARALPRIMNMRASGKTNLSAGLMEGMRLIRKADHATAAEADRGQRNRAVLLFTDGKATRGVTDTSTLLGDVRYQRANGAEDVSIFTFGFGGDHFPTRLNAIACETSGLYYFIESLEDIRNAFTDCLAGLAGMVAQQAALEISVDGSAARLKKVHFPNARFDSAGVCTIPLGTLYAQEDKNVLVEVHVPAALPQQCDVPTRILSTKLRYFSAVTGKISVVEASKQVIRPSSAVGAAIDKPPDPQWLHTHRCRMAVVDSILHATKVATHGDVHRAREQLNDTMDLVRSTTSAPKRVTQQLLADLYYVAAGYHDWRAYEDVGRQRSISTAMTHLQQRSSHAAGSVYEFEYKAQLKSKWQRNMARLEKAYAPYRPPEVPLERTRLENAYRGSVEVQQQRSRTTRSRRRPVSAPGRASPEPTLPEQWRGLSSDVPRPFAVPEVAVPEVAVPGTVIRSQFLSGRAAHPHSLPRHADPRLPPPSISPPPTPGAASQWDQDDARRATAAAGASGTSHNPLVTERPQTPLVHGPEFETTMRGDTMFTEVVPISAGSAVRKRPFVGKFMSEL